MRELVEKTIRVVRQVASNLRPAALNLGIGPALEWLVEDFGQRTGIAYELNLSGGEIDLDDTWATAVFRIVQESLTNVMRHADAASVAVSLKRDGEALLLEVKDDGRGFDYEAASHGPSFGLLGIRERVRVLGGSLTVDSGAGRGTVVSIHIPHIPERQT
jgi:signal transduction histidine kinase